MAVTTTNLIQGPATIWVAPFGSTEPVGPTTAPTTPWVDAGGTTGGVTLSISQEYAELEVDQIVDTPGRRLTKREVTVETNLAEATLENLALVLNGAAPTTVTNVKSWEAPDGMSVFSPSYNAIILDGQAPNGKVRRVTLRKVLSVEGTETVNAKDEQTVFSATFATHYVSASIKPFKIADDVTA